MSQAIHGPSEGIENKPKKQKIMQSFLLHKQEPLAGFSNKTSIFA